MFAWRFRVLRHLLGTMKSASNGQPVQNTGRMWLYYFRIDFARFIHVPHFESKIESVNFLCLEIHFTNLLNCLFVQKAFGKVGMPSKCALGTDMTSLSTDVIKFDSNHFSRVKSRK